MATALRSPITYTDVSLLARLAQVRPAWLFSDDFEAGEADLVPPWASRTTEAGNAIIGNSTTSPYAGTYCMLATFGGTDDVAYAITPTFSTSTELWISFVLRTTTWATVQDNSSILMCAAFAGATQMVVKFGARVNVGVVTYIIGNHDTTSIYETAAMGNGTNRRIDIHWKRSSGGSDGIIQLSVAGTQVFSTTTNAGDAAYSADRVRMGAWATSTGIPTATASLHIDNVIVSNTGPIP